MKIFEVQILSYHAINAISICSQGRIILQMLVTDIGNKIQILVTIYALVSLLVSGTKN